MQSERSGRDFALISHRTRFRDFFSTHARARSFEVAAAASIISCWALSPWVCRKTKLRKPAMHSSSVGFVLQEDNRRRNATATAGKATEDLIPALAFLTVFLFAERSPETSLGRIRPVRTTVREGTFEVFLRSVHISGIPLIGRYVPESGS